MGRPKIEIDPEQILLMARFHLTATEMAQIFQCSVATITKRFSKIISKGKAEGKQRLRQLQWRAAEKGNVSMLIWLGKQILHQRDQLDIEPPRKEPEPKVNLKNLTSEELREMRALLAKAAKHPGD